MIDMGLAQLRCATFAELREKLAAMEDELLEGIDARLIRNELAFRTLREEQLQILDEFRQPRTGATR